MDRGVQESFKRKDDSQDDTNWLTLYGDTMSVLLVFFILLFAISQVDQMKYQSIMESLSKALSGSFALEEENESPSEKDVVLQLEEIEKEALKDKDMELDEDLEDLSLLMEKIRGAVVEEGLEDKVQLNLEHRGVNMMVPGNAFFDSGRADIREESFPFLKKVSSILRSVEYKVLVEGHTDEVPISTLQYPSNWELSTGRACSVVKYFIEEGGIKPRRLSAAGYSHYKPRYPLTAENRARNRRVEIIVLREKYSAEKEDNALWN